MPAELEGERLEQQVTRFQAKGYMDRFINPRKAIEEERVRLRQEHERKKKIVPAQPERDVLRFLLEQRPAGALAGRISSPSSATRPTTSPRRA